jgi:putative membrane protein
MIRDYADHAANERTFLAWLRTGMAVVAFGFVIEKFNLFVLTLAGATSLDAAARAHFEKLPGPFGFGAGHAFIVVGILVILIATIRSCAPGDCWTTRRCTRPVSWRTWLSECCLRSS